MEVYKLIVNDFSLKYCGVYRLSDNTSIPFDPANTDYQQFKIDVASGVELQDPDGNMMTQEEVNDFLRTIP